MLLYTITADSITEYPSKKCFLINAKLKCMVKSEKVKYRDKFNIFKAFPALFLSGFNFIDLREYGGGEDNYFALFKIEGCFTDGHCNIWDFDVVNRYHYDVANRYDDEAKEFLNKIRQLYKLYSKEPDSKYTGHHNLFQLIPERYLRSDEYYNMQEYDGPGYKVSFHASSININNLFSSNTPDRKDKDVAEFLDKIDQLLAGKSEYQFEPIVVDK